MTCKAVSKCLLAVLLLAALMAGCDRQDDQAIIVQHVPKQPAPSTQPLMAQMTASAAKEDGALPPGHPQIPDETPSGGSTPAGSITYTDPPGWIKDPPMQFRYVSYHLGKEDAQAEISVSQLPPLGSSSTLANINRWRGLVGLAPLKEGDPQPSTDVNIGGEKGNLFDFVGSEKRQIVVWVPKGDQWWFFKIIGPADLVNHQQANFENFLKSIQFVSEKP